MALGKAGELTDAKRWQHSILGFLLVLPLLLASALYFNRGGDAVSQSVELNTSSSNVPMQAVQVADPGTMLEFNATLNQIRDNSWMGVDFGLENSDGELIYTKYLEYWRESGFDSDGKWSESKRRFTWFTRVDSADTYKIVVSAEPTSSNKQGKLTVEVEPNKASLNPWLIGGGLSLVLVFLCRAKISAMQAVASSIAVKLRKRFDPSRKKNKKTKVGAGRGEYSS